VQQRRARAHPWEETFGGNQAAEHVGCLGELARVHQRAHEQSVARLTRDACRRHLLEQSLDHTRLGHAQCHRPVVHVAPPFVQRRPLRAVEQRVLCGGALVAGRQLVAFAQPCKNPPLQLPVLLLLGLAAQ
jgi:hypothetical protein